MLTSSRRSSSVGFTVEPKTSFFEVHAGRRIGRGPRLVHQGIEPTGHLDF
jgi:hypothetical protein